MSAVAVAVVQVMRRLIERLRHWLRYRRILVTLENEALDAGYRVNATSLRERARRMVGDPCDRVEGR
jgi:hypothetical protein